MCFRILVMFALVTALTACGTSHRSSSGSSSGSSNRTSTGPTHIPTSTPSARPPRAAVDELYGPFSEVTMEMRRDSFLGSHHVEQVAPNRPYFNINSVRGTNLDPNTPVLHSYHRVYANAPLSATLRTELFIRNIPDSVYTALRRLPITEVDLYFTAQREVRNGSQADDVVSLKAAFWMFPNRPPIGTIEGTPPELQGSVAMGIFESDYPIEAEVPVNRLARFQVSYHDGLLSPNTGHVNMGAVPIDTSFSFYSIAYDLTTQRAAVTLHWSLSRNDADELIQVLNTNPNTTFEELLNSLDASPFFGGTSLMEKLHRLVRIVL